MEFIRRHSSTLKRIYLKEMCSFRLSWPFFVPQLHALAEEMSLDDVMVSESRVVGARSVRLPLGSSAGAGEFYFQGDPNYDIITERTLLAEYSEIAV